MARQHDTRGHEAPHLVMTRRAAIAAVAAMPLNTATASASDAVAALIVRVAEKNTAFMRGDMQRWSELVAIAPDFTLMATLRRSGELRFRHEARALGRDVSILPQRNV